MLNSTAARAAAPRFCASTAAAFAIGLGLGLQPAFRLPALHTFGVFFPIQVAPIASLAAFNCFCTSAKSVVRRHVSVFLRAAAIHGSSL